MGGWKDVYLALCSWMFLYLTSSHAGSIYFSISMKKYARRKSLVRVKAVLAKIPVSYRSRWVGGWVNGWMKVHAHQ